MANLVSTTFTGDVSLNGNGTLRANGQVDATAYTGNGAGLTGVDPFEANTSMIFNQASAPTGWTKQTGTALANTAMSIVTGSGGGTGGSDSFYSTFASSRNTDIGSATVSVQGSVGGTTLSTPTIASHNHPRPGLPTGNFGNNQSPNNSQPTSFHPSLGVGLNNVSGNERIQQNPQSPFNLGNAGGGGSHSHPFSVSSSSLGGTISMPAMNVKYANVIVANKD